MSSVYLIGVDVKVNVGINAGNVRWDDLRAATRDDHVVADMALNRAIDTGEPFNGLVSIWAQGRNEAKYQRAILASGRMFSGREQ